MAKSPYARLADMEEANASPKIEIKQPIPIVKEKVSNTVNTLTNKHVNTLTSNNSDERVGDIESIRKAVKEIGKELSGYRFTAKEKEALGDIVYSLKKKGMNTSEGLIVRIALNFMINDFEANKQSSILVEVLQSLQA